MRIAFWTPSLDVRGSCVALYDYADYSEKLLGHTSIIITPIEGVKISDILGIEKFQKRFEIYYYNNFSEVDEILLKTQCTLFYTIKYGKNDGIISQVCKTVVHCVFDMSEPHGDIYAGVSESIARKFGKNTYVPHMVSLKPSKNKNLRKDLNIPENAVVFGRYGGMDTFDLEFARNAIRQVVREYSHIYFLFINTPIFDTHPKIIHLPQISTDSEKNMFINTCNGNLECGSLGHSFGLAIGEFSVNNKITIAYNGNTWNREHINILGDSAIYFSNETELYNILRKFDPNIYRNIIISSYDKFSPENVMKKFSKVFIDNEL